MSERSFRVEVMVELVACVPATNAWTRERVAAAAMEFVRGTALRFDGADVDGSISIRREAIDWTSCVPS